MCRQVVARRRRNQWTGFRVKRERGKELAGEKILLVDDDQDFTAATGTILEANGFEVAIAHNTGDAEKAIDESKPELILLDVMMEHMDDGFNLCRSLKQAEATSSIPIIMLTGITGKTGLKFSPKTDEEWLPADDYLDKPVDPEELLKRVRKLLG